MYKELRKEKNFIIFFIFKIKKNYKMGFVNKYFEPKTYSKKVIFLCIFIFLDIILNSFTQFFDFGSTNILKEYPLGTYDKDPGDLAYGLMR